ncbi:MAG: aldehyde ferredoxin oxidoreductase family protein [Deltaproteobacteria bacterium]|nr:aldehyde ferredoxin oxidoreductase family protein [Deltaproteobacteria bacterium]MBW2072375.1 aldehyde ferredoxin oxidoreductase family protein [Deltaproteobacteria bacterium]
MKGFHGKLLVVDMTEQTFEVLQLDNDLLSRGLGGKGLAVQLLLQHNPPAVDPFAPENRLILATGPLTGSPIWGSCRHGIYSKSPQTGFFSESYAGGTVAEYMNGSGFDAIMIHGAAPEPRWLEINEEGVLFHSAHMLWGQDTMSTEDSVKAWILRNRPEAGKCGVICIGPAGEKLVTFAVVENDYWRSAGRTGPGAVMGSKKLKAIAFWGKQRRSFADSSLLKNLAKSTAQTSRENPGVKAYKSMGTPMLVDIMNETGGFPTRYWHKGRAEHREQINATALHSRCKVEPHACRKCFMACGRLTTIKEGRHAGLKIEGPEYETIYSFGGLCEVDSIEEIAYLNDICDRLGLDTITAGNLVAFTIEAKRQGRLDYSIDYGDVDGMAQLIRKIAAREGIGDLLARGIRAAAEEWHMDEQAIHVKGLEPAGYDPRVLKGMGLAYGTADRGACHLRATFYKPELSGMVDPEQIEGKAEIFAEWEDRLTIFDTLILCRFYRDLYQWEELAAMIRGATGIDWHKESMRHVASEIKDNIRRFNVREGLVPEDDHLPPRFHEEPLPETEQLITREQMRQMLREYYRTRGWDEQGRPPEN